MNYVNKYGSKFRLFFNWRVVFYKEYNELNEGN